MKNFSLLLLFISSFSYANALGDLDRKVWIHGSENCKENQNPALDVYEFSSSTYILRQNKCSSFEAPFVYVLMGKETTLLLDTGALSGKEDILEFIENLPKSNDNESNHLLVAHTHSHADHTSGDPLFRNRKNTTLIEPDNSSVVEYFGFESWPDDRKEIDLGDRRLSVIPIPGHQEESIAVYDHKTKWLMVGDTLYPGRIYVKNWKEYRNSIQRLVEFSKSHEINAILGSHIEMSSEPFTEYRVGSTYQPKEASLILEVDDLLSLHKKLLEQEKAKTIKLSKFTVQPMSWFQKTLQGGAKLLKGSK